MKCPHCGIEIRDTMTVCMYCGGKIPQRKGAVPPVAGRAPDTVTRAPVKPPQGKRPAPPEDEGEDEEEGGLSAYLQPGEQVRIGSLNVSVKKFFFHAYLTDRRIFLIDTQEKKLKVTAKDIPLDTITATDVETSETSDPVLVLSVRSTDDEIKTMKIVFTGNGLDRTAEVDEWVEILNEQGEQKRPKKPQAPRRPAPVPEEPADEDAEEPPRGEWDGDEEPDEPVRAPPRPAAHAEIRPVRRPAKDHEKQPPVKRLLPLYTPENDGEDEDPRPMPSPPAKTHGSPSPGRRVVPQQAPPREIPPAREPAEKSVKKVEVQSAMKGALKGAMQPVTRPAERAAPQPSPVHGTRKPAPVAVEPAPVPEEEDLQPAEETPGEELGGPLFCQNCGKKLPSSANFCPGCGTKIVSQKEKKTHKPTEKEGRKPDDTGRTATGEHGRPRPPVKKVPKGSEMTILHKFLRR